MIAHNKYYYDSIVYSSQEINKLIPTPMVNTVVDLLQHHYTTHNDDIIIIISLHTLLARIAPHFQGRNIRRFYIRGLIK